jgi:NADH:ubiquinone oxidoreductase subunit 6 (subunit J)
VVVQSVFLAFFGIAAVWFAVVVFRTYSMVRSALALLFSQAAIGGMFLAMQTEFLGVLQIMMMATEMAIMAVFMVMYMMDPGGLGGMDMTHQKKASLAAGGLGGLVALGTVLLVDWGEIAAAPGAERQVHDLGIEIMGRSMLVFEVAGVTILIAMIATTATAIATAAERRAMGLGEERG